MITITTNTSEVIGQLEQKLGLLFDQDRMLRTVAVSMVPVLRKRVHEDGLNANGAPLGGYSPEYLKKRQGPPYNRTPENKKVLSLTRQMENDMKALPVETGWGIGYSNPNNYDKAIANERRENVKILTALTPDEYQLVHDIAEDYVNEIINAIS